MYINLSRVLVVLVGLLLLLFLVVLCAVKTGRRWNYPMVVSKVVASSCFATHHTLVDDINERGDMVDQV
jgi:presenilin-like A22 family membrane protease